MNRILRLSIIASALSFAAVARAAEPGYVDLGKFAPVDGCQFVEVNLQTPLLKFASIFVDKEEPAVAAVIRNLKQVRVNVVGFNDETRDETTARVRSIRQDLEQQGWTKVVTVQESNEVEDVAVFVKMNDTDTIDGVVVTVIARDERQAVLVNVVGDIRPEQIAALGKSLNVPSLSKLTMPGKGNGA